MSMKPITRNKVTYAGNQNKMRSEAANANWEWRLKTGTKKAKSASVRGHCLWEHLEQVSHWGRESQLYEEQQGEWGPSRVKRQELAGFLPLVCGIEASLLQLVCGSCFHFLRAGTMKKPEWSTSSLLSVSPDSRLHASQTPELLSFASCSLLPPRLGCTTSLPSHLAS